jgi:hypothetical protein
MTTPKMTDAKDGRWFLCDCLPYADYSGTKPTYENNVRVFAETFEFGYRMKTPAAHALEVTKPRSPT